MEKQISMTDEEILASYDDMDDDFGMTPVGYKKKEKPSEENVAKKEKSKYWEVMGSLVSKKKVSNEDILKHYNGYMAFNMFMVHPRAIYMANKINSARGNKYIAKEKIAEYRALKSVIDLPRNTRLQADTKDKHLDIIIDTIMYHFKVAKTTARDYFRILGGKRVLEILELYARKNEKKMSAKELEKVTKIRSAITAKKKILEGNK